MDKLSVIVPCYNEQEVLDTFYDTIINVLSSMDVDYELLFVDDGSKDDTINVFRRLAEKDERVRFISFSRNFGKEAAMYAGLENALGNMAVIMDADLQHPPKLLPQMYKALREEGYDMCGTRRVSRTGEPPIRSFFARRFYKLMNKMSDVELVDGAQDFCMMSKPVIEGILKMKEVNRFTKGIYSWIGFRKKWIEQENVERTLGETTWSFWGLLRYAIEGIVGFSTVPLIISSLFGMLFCFIALIMIVFVCVKTIFFGEPVQGYPTLICTISLIGGLIMLSIGVMGQYMAKMYLEVKNRPIYLIKERE
ncbi:MAG: glycosyltransferase family 2 protein [Lachnospiraceae bacterium]|nr:glycosyltransferase family 2 protein [Lachnospiraceae bacterium]